jgi:hypothetical protein
MLTTLRRLITNRQRKSSPRKQNYFRPRLEALEERWCPATDTWKATVSNLWSNPANWSLNRIPLITDQALFDGGNVPIGQANNKPVTVDQNVNPGSMTFTNQYTATMTINPGVLLDTANGFVLDAQNPQATATISFGTNSKLQADAGGSAVYNFQFTGARATVYIKSGATLTAAGNLNSDTNSDFLIAGSLTLANSAVDTFHRGAGITVSSGGSMAIQAMPNVVLSDNNEGGIIENWGSFGYVGLLLGNNTTTVAMAFLNHSTATLDKGTIAFDEVSTATNGYAVKMDGGSLVLNHAVDVKLLSGYYQTGGTLTSLDAATMDLFGGQRIVELDGGIVNMVIPGQANMPTTLNITGGDLNFNGAEYDARINGAGGGAGQADEINVSGNINIAGNSKLVVTALNRNPPVRNQVWDLLSSGNKKITGTFATTFPFGVHGPDPTQLSNGIYEISSFGS